MPSERCLSIQEMLTGQRLCHSESHNDSVLAALNQQRSDGILCDVTLIAEEQKFHAHKAVLAACSDYFRAMFSLCMVESGADEVNLHGVTSLGLKQALEFAYTGQILLEPGVIQDVLAAGSHLQLLELLNLCSHYLIQELNSFNYLDLYRLADLFNLTLLEKAVIDFLVKHLSELLKSRPEDVLTLPYCLLQEVLKSDRLTSLSEEQIWQKCGIYTVFWALRGDWCPGLSQWDDTEDIDTSSCEVVGTQLPLPVHGRAPTVHSLRPNGCGHSAHGCPVPPPRSGE
ncbi:kelch-like protein 32 isoform X10 [Talpa occidentalis]|uniref:kelch-like protein 32 isoform X10 n=1 Tax=Talpa occidentalis TaxID=50954 RepID=UPI0023F77F41|nr:kelch-like protein 32 isoform X10 [Talpa occidentalis]